IDLEPDEWINDSGCSKHMTGNQKLISTYKAYNGGNVIFGSNLCGNIIGKGTISHGSLKIAHVEHVDNLRFNLISTCQIFDSKCKVIFSENDSEIIKDGKVIGRGIRKKGVYVMKLGNKLEDKICLATIDENSTLWHRILGHANMHLIQSLASKELVRNLPKLRCLEHIHMDLFDPSVVRSYGENLYTLVIVDDYSRTDHGREFDNEVQFGEFCNANGYSQHSKAYVILNKHTMKIEESLNMILDETPPPSKSSPLVDDDLDEEETSKIVENKNLENDVEDEVLVIDEIVNIKEFKDHPLDNDHVLSCLCHMLYFIAMTKPYNIAFFFTKRMEFVTKQARLILPYGMLLTRLLRFVMTECPQLSNDHYVLYDHVMYPLTAQQERKTRKDRGTTRGRSSTSSSSAFGQPSSSHPNGDDDDGNDEGTSRASTPSPTRFVNLLSNNVPRIFSNPPNIDPNMEDFYTRQTKILNRQVQLRDEQCCGIRTIKKGIKNLLKGKKKK
nr:retrotransposon protein [Tanacetum cinerariifolium]